MQNNKTKVALIYDFDETLSTQYMQDFCLIPQFGMTPDEFWAKANQWSRENGADQVTGSMYYFMKTAKEMGIRLTKENLKECGKGVIYFPGVLEWFERINRFGADGTPVWPARVINYSIKTQYLSKINKGLGKNDDVAVNEFTPDEERPIPFKRMIYFGDGMTDIPSMKLTKERGGNAIAVYDQSATSKQKALRLLVDNRVNFALHADYRENHELDQVVKTILDRIATERDLDILKAREEKKKQLLK